MIITLFGWVFTWGLGEVRIRVGIDGDGVRGVTGVKA
jgi:hypothetical protein